MVFRCSNGIAKPPSPAISPDRASGLAALALLAGWLAASPAQAQTPNQPQPSFAIPGIDAPALAALGPYSAGVATWHLTQPAQPDPLRGTKAPEIADRHLSLRVWYPARPGGLPTAYHTALPGPDSRPVPFVVPGIAAAGAAPADGHFPLIILAHGYSNTPELLAWLGENLATKGYVVAAPAFEDPPITDLTKLIGPIARRPLDIAFAAAQAQQFARAGKAPFAHADASRTGLIGYSMGGYGVLAAGGAPLSPALAPATRGVLAPYVAGAPKAAELKLADVHAVIAISPASHIGKLMLFAPAAMAALHTPTLFIAGSQDHVVGYDPGVRTLFDSSANTTRYLLTFREAGHDIALTGAPPEMQHTVWNQDWFEDPVWRKSRLTGILAHFITAFLDLNLKGETAKASYLNGLVPNSDDGVWDNPPAGYGLVSPGAPSATLWKGFQAVHASGLMLERHAPGG